jgi:polysaccharide export outer membrane protein
MAQPSAVIDTSPDKVARLHIGDTVTITFSGPPEPMDPQEPTINEDGTISLPDIGRVEAAGKTPGELQDAIHDLYVPKYLTHLNVTVKTSSDRVYYVRGEVKAPGRLIYAGDITVSKAITSAGDFTDFADHSSVWLIRANGDRFKLNLNKILDGDQPDPPVYPGDQIEVERRIF